MRYYYGRDCAMCNKDTEAVEWTRRTFRIEQHRNANAAPQDATTPICSEYCFNAYRGARWLNEAQKRFGFIIATFNAERTVWSDDEQRVEGYDGKHATTLHLFSTREERDNALEDMQVSYGENADRGDDSRTLWIGELSDIQFANINKPLANAEFVPNDRTQTTQIKRCRHTDMPQRFSFGRYQCEFCTERDEESVRDEAFEDKVLNSCSHSESEIIDKGEQK